jgi:hypothetical protein
MKNFKKLAYLAFSGAILMALALTVSLGLPNQALAATPSLSVTSNGNNYIYLSVVNADPYASISLYYYSQYNSAPVFAGTVGSTNSVGAFSTTLNSNSYNIATNSRVYVVINSQYSNSVNWPYCSQNGNYDDMGPLRLSQTSLSLNAGQGQAISISGGGTSYSISDNSNPTAISSLISGHVLNVFGSAPGTGTLRICTSGSYTNPYNTYGNNGYYGYNGSNGGCVNLYVTVTGYYSAGYYNGGYYNNVATIYNPAPNNYLSYQSYYNSQPSHVYLNQLPATGIGFGMKVVLFSIGLIVWSLFMSYVFVSRKNRKLIYKADK